MGGGMPRRPTAADGTGGWKRGMEPGEWNREKGIGEWRRGMAPEDGAGGRNRK